ncbi:hypothetical protein C943_04407 [Mariniradius saccharolyticus AK6]|uniref:Uncharacterized protein n=1 Tax=Mariniradius saccharolyticus AK6 TaxID=1239962 RepID=M7XF85_9BACT|nr:hypothetical protein C943_04407 [Mariniradius saccharolyticus AK6]
MSGEGRFKGFYYLFVSYLIDVSQPAPSGQLVIESLLLDLLFSDFQ